MALWLSHMGAAVHGYALQPPSTPNIFGETQLHTRLAQSTMGDIRDLNLLTSTLQDAKPSVVIHMAAQSLVRKSYNNPVETFSANVMGTVNLLEAARRTGSVDAIINITTDKCYENREWIWPYRENDRLGGLDPYSSSKACAELVSVAYRNSFLDSACIKLASVRAGNVIGGGDWAEDRLIPDFFRALSVGQVLKVRYPGATRPWQHVLEPLCGYLMLGEKLVTEGSDFAEAWNFGPEDSDAKSVSWILDHLCAKVPGSTWERECAVQPHEAGALNLDSSKAKARLSWTPRWPLEVALDKTIAWHHAWRRGTPMADFSIGQIESYLDA